MNPVRWLLLLLTPMLLLSLSACQWWRSAPAPVAVVVTPPPAPPRDVVAELRAAAAAMQSSLEIVPVENPAIAVLLSGARADQAAGQQERAEQQVQLALEMEPDNPRVLQEMAELHLHAGRHAQAAELARRSFARSSQLGELCARNQLTLAEAQLAQGADPAAQRQLAEDCGIKPLPRL